MNFHPTIASICVLVVMFHSVGTIAEISSGRIKGDDEPRIVSWRVLEGVTEPFDSSQAEEIPAWKQMKNAADHKTASLMIQQALHEYGQLLRHPYMFGDMPMEERYDVFLSMSKLLKVMGFHQRAELLLYEAMSYTTNPHEAHLQLGLLFLDKEDLEKAKMHLKNCLFYKEADVLILIHLAVILIAEGRTFEAKFFLSRILTALESRVKKLSFVVSEEDFQSMTQRMDYNILTAWVEDLIVKVFYGEFRLAPSATAEMLRLFSNLYQWLSDGEMAGRFVFDLGQSLYEGGRPKVGHMMMRRGYETSNETAEGEVSTKIVRMRLALDYPVVPDSPLDILQAYLNMTNELSETSMSYQTIDIENILDLYWPLPLLHWSGLPMMPVIKELLWRFHGGPNRTDAASKHWLVDKSYDDIIDAFHPRSTEQVLFPRHLKSPATSAAVVESAATDVATIERFDALSGRHEKVSNGIRTVVIPPGSNELTGNREDAPIRLEVGLLGGHMNNHPTGQMVFRRIISLQKAISSSSHSSSGSFRWSDVINLTLIALPLVPDAMTKRIASAVNRIVNLPMDINNAWRIIQELHLDIIIFPDWQPFPDQQSVFFQTRRMAPVQMCFFVRGGSCVSDEIDYYLLPSEAEESYLNAVPASDVRGHSLVVKRQTNGKNSSSIIEQGGNNFTSSSDNGGIESSDEEEIEQLPPITRQFKRYHRPMWKEIYSEQVVLLDWPILTPQVVREVADAITFEEAASVNRRTQNSDGTHSATSSATTSASPSIASASTASDSSADGSATASSGGFDKPRQVLDDSVNIMKFSPLEIEGKVFFEGQPVAVMPVYPNYVSPLMDDTLFKIMRSVPSLHVVLALPNTFFTHAHQDSKHKVSWARKLVRRLWSRGGNLFHRIRLLPAPMSDQRVLQLLRQADMVLDTFPIGNSFYLLSLAIGVGTPVVTMRSGTRVRSSKDDMKEMRTFLLQQKHLKRFTGNPMSQFVLHFDMPWNPSISAIAGFYQRLGLDEHFVANGTADYFRLAVKLATDRELAYRLRVQLLEAVDQSPSNTGSSMLLRSRTTKVSTISSSPPIGAVTSEWDEFLAEEGEFGASFTDTAFTADSAGTSSVDADAAGTACGACVDDLGRFLLAVGTPFARARVFEATEAANAATGKKRPRKRRVNSGGDSSDFLKMDDVPGISAIS